MAFFKEDGGLDLFRVGNIIAMVLVSLLLISNLLALFLSFPVVFEGSPEEYSSGIKGSLPLHSFIDKNTQGIEVEYQYLNEGKGPLMISVVLDEGRVPSLPLSVHLPRWNGNYEQYLLHDTFLDNGSWKGITIIPHRLEEGIVRPQLHYETADRSLETGYFLDEIIINESRSPDIEIGCTSSLEINEEISIIPIGHLPQMMDIVDIDISGFNGEMLVDEEDGAYKVDLGLYNISGWRTIDITLVREGTYNETAGPFLLNFIGEPSEYMGVGSLKIEQVLQEFDKLYEQENIRSLDGIVDTISVHSNTYHRIDLNVTYDRNPSDVSWKDGNGTYPYPLPTIRSFIEGKEIHIRPESSNGSYSGIFRTTGGYGNDTVNGLMVIASNKDRAEHIFKKEIYLVTRQAPIFFIDPDPYHPRDEIPEHFTIEFREGWELTSYREFEGIPTINIGERELEMQYEEPLNDEGYPYMRYYSEVSNEELLEDKEMTMEVEATYSMEIIVSFIFFHIPFPIIGIGIPIWFTLISIAIAISLLVLFFRSGFSIKPGKKEWFQYKDPTRTDSDISILSRTFAGAFFFSWSIVILFNLLDQPTPGLAILGDAVPVWIRMVLLAEASVWEEVITRVMFIGLPLMIFASWSKKWPDRIKILLGGQGKFGKGEVILILISSSLFGLAHIGWGPWKVVPTFVSGALFGYLYIKVGLHAAIAMHFLFDYSSFIFDHVEGLPYLPYYAIYVFCLFIGGFFLASIIVDLKKWLETRAKRRLNPGWWLGAHSLLSLLLLAYIFLIGGSMEYIIFLAFVIPLNITGYFLRRAGLKEIAGIIVSASSLITLGLAPIGMAWLFDSSKKDINQNQDP